MKEDVKWNPFAELDHSFEVENSLFYQTYLGTINIRDSDHGEESNMIQKESIPGTRQKFPKLEKEKKIRTSTNAQKTYHLILKLWLAEQGYSSILPKYRRFYNARVYFILILDEILKHVDGKRFLIIYQNSAREIMERKNHQIEQLDKIKSNSEQSNHLKRVIQEIQFSIKACQKFIEGKVFTAIVIVYKRNQNKITKIKQFEKAIRIFKDIAGYDPEDF